MLIKDKGQPFPDFFGYVKKYSPLCGSLMWDSVFYDAEDLQQEVFLKLLKHFKTESEWKSIENPEGYIIMTAVHTALTLKGRSPANQRSIDDDDNGSLDAYLSDEGSSCSRINREIDYAQIISQINKMLEEFSEYERLLIQLNFREGCKPALVADLLVTEYAAIFEKVYPSLALGNAEEIKKIVQIDCNAVCAKFRQKLMKEIGNIDKNPEKRKSENK